MKGVKSRRNKEVDGLEVSSRINVDVVGRLGLGSERRESDVLLSGAGLFKLFLDFRFPLVSCQRSWLDDVNRRKG